METIDNLKDLLFQILNKHEVISYSGDDLTEVEITANAMKIKDRFTPEQIAYYKESNIDLIDVFITSVLLLGENNGIRMQKAKYNEINNICNLINKTIHKRICELKNYKYEKTHRDR